MSRRNNQEFKKIVSKLFIPAKNIIRLIIIGNLNFTDQNIINKHVAKKFIGYIFSAKDGNIHVSGFIVLAKYDIVRDINTTQFIKSINLSTTFNCVKLVFFFKEFFFI